jgi:acylphosphatase
LPDILVFGRAFYYIHPMLQAVVIRISGRVQGVGFRYFTRDTADSCGGITGWVRNGVDRSVEIYAEGQRPDLERFLTMVRQGPPMSRVDDLQTSWRSLQERTRDDFDIEI